MPRLTVGSKFDFQLAVAINELAFHVTAQVKIAAVGNTFEFPEFAGRQEREGILDVGRAGRVVTQFLTVVLAQPQVVASEAEVRVPAEAPVAPIPIPSGRLGRVAEELDLHLLELARAEGE